MTYVATIIVRGFKAFNKKRKEAVPLDRIKEPQSRDQQAI